MSQMHNPYAEERDHTVYEIGHGMAWLFAIAFMSLLWLPPLCEHITQALHGKIKETPAARMLRWEGNETLQQHLRAVEKRMDDSGYSVALRRATQDWLIAQSGEGNRRTFIGYNGWLFYQPDLKAITGYGPLRPEPFSVMKDPDLAKLRDPKDLILEFAAQLRERGVPLLLVPLPLKPMLYSEFVTGESDYTWITHPDAARFYEELRAQGVDVLDLTKDFATLRQKRKHVFVRVPDRKDKEAIAKSEANAKELTDAFLKQDTHWTPEAMRFAAEKVAAHIKEKYPEAAKPGFREIRAQDGGKRSSIGDLVRLLDLEHPEDRFDKESVFLKFISDNTLDRDGKVSLLGDSFLNIYDDPTLGFEDPSHPDERIRGGFSQTLSLLLEQPLDIIAMNGRGATAVRADFAKRPDDQVRAKKLVVWVIASRDVLLSRTAAREANIEWAGVKFNPNRSPNALPTNPDSGAPNVKAPEANAPLVVEATLMEKSKNQEANGTPYRDALHTAIYEVQKVLSGKLDAKRVTGVQWTFKDKQMQPPSSFAPGHRYRLTLVPWDSKKELQTINLQDDTLDFEAPRMFVEKAEPLD